MCPDKSVDEALNEMLGSSVLMLRMLSSQHWIRARQEAANVNPLLLLHERLARQVETLLLVRTRCARNVPPEAWGIIVGHVLAVSLVPGCDEPVRRATVPRPVLRHYGYAPDGRLRLDLDPVLSLPRLADFRPSFRRVIGAVRELADPDQMAEHERALGAFTSKAAWNKIRSLIAAFELPVPKHLLGPPAVNATTTVHLGRGGRDDVGVSRFGRAQVRVHLQAVIRCADNPMAVGRR